jgi:hypothetical protein
MNQAAVASRPAPVQPVRPVRQRRLRRQAISTLLGNWRGTSTVPAASLYPHQWSWDSAFIAVGLAHVSPRRPWAELQSLFRAQWSDGRVPQIVFNRSVDENAYFPGPAFWRPLPPDGPPPDVSTTGLVQPPIHAFAALVVARHSARRDCRAAVRRLYPHLVAYHDYLFRRRLVARGLVAIVHPWESGLDNSPAWDEPLAAVPADVTGIAELRRDVTHGRNEQRPTHEDYARYLYIAATYRDRGYRDDVLVSLPFCVVDPLVNTLLVLSERALAALARLIGRPHEPHLERAAELEARLHDYLFDAELGCYAARDMRSGRSTGRRTVAGLVPLLLPGLPDEHRHSLVRTLVGPSFRLGAADVMGVPSYDLTASDLDLRRYWRGPTWVNVNWLVWLGLRHIGERGLASRLADSVLRLVAGAGFRECFNPLTGEGLGAQDFSWSAALVLDLLAAEPPVVAPSRCPARRRGRARWPAGGR